MEANPPWKCDQCGHPINSVEDGWVEWLMAPLLSNGKEVSGNSDLCTTSLLRQTQTKAAATTMRRTGSPPSDTRSAIFP